jgi:hypothetical protein
MASSVLVSPRLIDFILVFTLAEAVVLIIWNRLSRRGLSSGVVGAMLLPGIFLLLATRAALADAAWPWLPVALAAALIAHLIDLRQRWRR